MTGDTGVDDLLCIVLGQQGGSLRPIPWLAAVCGLRAVSDLGLKWAPPWPPTHPV